MIFRSIATQLQLWHCAVPSLLLNLLLILFYQNQEKALTENIDIELKSRISGILPFAHQVVASLDHENSAEAGESLDRPPACRVCGSQGCLSHKCRSHQHTTLMKTDVATSAPS